MKEQILLDDETLEELKKINDEYLTDLKRDYEKNKNRKSKKSKEESKAEFRHQIRYVLYIAVIMLHGYAFFIGFKYGRLRDGFNKIFEGQCFPNTVNAVSNDYDYFGRISRFVGWARFDNLKPFFSNPVCELFRKYLDVIYCNFCLSLTGDPQAMLALTGKLSILTLPLVFKKIIDSTVDGLFKCFEDPEYAAKVRARADKLVAEEEGKEKESASASSASASSASASSSSASSASSASRLDAESSSANYSKAYSKAYSKSLKNYEKTVKSLKKHASSSSSSSSNRKTQRNVVASNRKVRVLSIDHGKLTTQQITKEELDKNLKKKGLYKEFDKLIKNLQSEHVIGHENHRVGGFLGISAAGLGVAGLSYAKGFALKYGIKCVIYGAFALLNKDAVSNLLSEKEKIIRSAEQLQNFPWANMILNLYGIGDPDISRGFWTSVSARLYGGMTMQELYSFANVFSDMSVTSITSFANYAASFYTNM